MVLAAGPVAIAMISGNLELIVRAVLAHGHHASDPAESSAAPEPLFVQPDEHQPWLNSSVTGELVWAGNGVNGAAFSDVYENGVVMHDGLFVAYTGHGRSIFASEFPTHANFLQPETVAHFIVRTRPQHTNGGPRDFGRSSVEGYLRNRVVKIIRNALNKAYR